MDGHFTSSLVLQHVRLVVTKSCFKFSRGGAYILHVAFGTSGQINNILRSFCCCSLRLQAALYKKEKKYPISDTENSLHQLVIFFFQRKT